MKQVASRINTLNFQAAVLFLISPASLLVVGKFVGSKSCATCHKQVYESWQSTQHSYSLLTAEEARRANFLLPAKRRSGAVPSIRSWKNVSYVLEGRQRITCIDWPVVCLGQQLSPPDREVGLVPSGAVE